MKRISIAITFIATSVLSTAPAVAQGGWTDFLAITHVNVVPMDTERVVENLTVVIQNGVIEAYGDADVIDVPEGAFEVDGRGKYLMPGLAEMHGHLPNPRPDLPDRWAEDVLFLYIANGVTTVRGMQGNARHLELRERIESREIWGPHLYVASPSYNGRNTTDAQEAMQRVRMHKEQGFDLLKIHEGLRQDVYDAIARAAREVRIPFAGHVPDDVGYFAALEAGQETVDHLDNMYDAVDGDPERIPQVVDALIDAEAWAVPTEVLWETVYIDPQPSELMLEQRTEVRYVPEALRNAWTRAIEARQTNALNTRARADRIAFRRALIKAVHDRDAGLMLGTDSPQIFSVPGFSIHREMAVMVESGLTPYEVLRTGTVKVAEYLGRDTIDGTIAAKKRADLILLNANPLESVENVANRAGVVVNGRWLPEDVIQQRLEQMAAAYAGG